MRKNSDHRRDAASARRDTGAHSIGGRVVGLVIALVLAGCGTRGDPSTQEAARDPAREPPREATPDRAREPATQPPATLQGWLDDDLRGFRQALDAQCALPRRPPGWTRHCDTLRTIPARADDALRAWVARHFVARPLGSSAGATGLITGYHEPEIRGSRTRSARFTVPLLRFPGQEHPLARATRATIESGPSLAALAIAWVEDPVDAFFLQVQGSGRIRLADGAVMRLGYAANNGHAYRAIGSVLVARGALTAGQVDAPAIKAWLRAHPEAAISVMHENARYIFFRELPPAPPEQGPPGSLGAPLTALRSIAVDPAKVPPGAMLWLETTDPVDQRPIRRLVLAQDTGAAILGEVRADLFWGTGPRAEQAAGLMKSTGRLWMLEPAGR